MTFSALRLPAAGLGAVLVSASLVSAAGAATVYRHGAHGSAHHYAYAHHHYVRRGWHGHVYGYGHRPGYAYNPGAAAAAGVIGGIPGAAASYPYCDYGAYGYPYGACADYGYYGPDYGDYWGDYWPYYGGFGYGYGRGFYGRHGFNRGAFGHPGGFGGFAGGSRFATGGFGHMGGRRRSWPHGRVRRRLPRRPLRRRRAFALSFARPCRHGR